MGIFGPLKVNQPIEIEINLMSGPRRYKSRVEGIIDRNLVVAAPMVSGQLIPINIGREVTISYLDNVALYTFDTVVLSTESKPVPTLTLDEPRNVKRVQRRNFVRMDAKLSMTFILLNEELKKDSEEYAATTIDISGGGIMFLSEQPLHINDILEVNLFLPDNVVVNANGKVVRVVEKKQPTKLMYAIGLEFTVIEEGARDNIIRYIFNKQRELRKRGLI